MKAIAFKSSTHENQMLQFSIDTERCIQCGECAQDCPAEIIELDEYPKIIDESRCIRCQHCLAVCPTAALSILGKDPDESRALKGNVPQQERLAVLIKGRRSVRRYKDENVPPEMIDSLLNTVWHAPTGVNAQKLLFTVINDKEVMQEFRKEVYSRLAEHVVPEEDSGSYAMRFLQRAVKAHTQSGKDIIFRGAPHMLAVSASTDSPCPVQDTHIALTYFELMAQAMGLGTLWNGMLTWTINDILPDLRPRLGIPDSHQLGYVMVFGNPAVEYHRTVQRGPAAVNVVEWK